MTSGGQISPYTAPPNIGTTSNHDRICEYHHGNDSGQDNSTIFQSLDIINSPDLTAFLIKDYECLAEVSHLLGDEEASAKFYKEADTLMENFISYFIWDGLPAARYTFSGYVISSASILPYISLILGDRLPTDIRQNMLAKIKSDYLAPYGIATEALTSDAYLDDAYWRGPIWGPTSLLLIDSIGSLGESDLYEDLKSKYRTLILQSGFRENFDAKSGKGLRDYSFSWTAAVFLHFTR